MYSARRGVVICAIGAVVALVVTALSVSPAAALTSPAGQVGSSSSSELAAPVGAGLPFPGSTQSVCGTPGVGVAQCLADVLKPSGTSPEISFPTGLSPLTIENVYGFSSTATAGTGQTIALVDAFDDSNAASDLNEFSQQYGLPLECQNGSSPPGCFYFTQVNQTGGSTLPASTDSDWDLETSLDIEWAHALAPAANILLVEADDNTTANLLVAEQYAAANAKYVSNSWGMDETSTETSLDSIFSEAGVSYFAAAGDAGGVVEWPSASPDVVSVGGTSLTFTSGGTLAQESAWSDGGGGCSSYELASPYQSTGTANCAGMRATPDLSLDADPNSGVSVYDSTPYESQTGWWTVGGTSASTPMVAAEAAVKGADVNAAYIYATPANIPFRDITTGSNGHPSFDRATTLPPGSAPGPIPRARPLASLRRVSPAASRSRGARQVVRRQVATPSGGAPPPVTRPRTWPPSRHPHSATPTRPPAQCPTYYYVVQASDGNGLGPYSNEASAKSSGGSATSYTVTFNANGGTGTMAPESSSVAALTDAERLHPLELQLLGLEHLRQRLGRPRIPTARTTVSQPASPSSPNGRLTPLPSPSTPTADPGRWPPRPTTPPTALTPNAFTRTGYSFSGWNTAANGSGGTAYPDGPIYPFTTNATLYAQWALLFTQ